VIERDPDDGGRVTTLEGIRPRSWVWSVAAADFNGDGRDDVAVGYHSLESGAPRLGIDVLMSTPGGAHNRLELEKGLDVAVRALAAGDLDGDGRPDLVAIADDGSIRLFLGRGNGRFEHELEPALAAAEPGCRGNHAALADLDGDGRDELIASFGSESCPGVGALRAWSFDPRPADAPVSPVPPGTSSSSPGSRP